MDVIVFFTQPRRLTCRKNSERGSREIGMMHARNSPARGSSGRAASFHVHVPPHSTAGILPTLHVLIRPEVKSRSTSSFDGTARRRGCSLVGRVLSAMRP